MSNWSDSAWNGFVPGQGEGKISLRVAGLTVVKAAINIGGGSYISANFSAQQVSAEVFTCDNYLSGSTLKAEEMTISLKIQQLSERKPQHLYW